MQMQLRQALCTDLLSSLIAVVFPTPGRPSIRRDLPSAARSMAMSALPGYADRHDISWADRA